MGQFYRKHKVKILMLLPVLFGLAFFLISSISALLTVHNTVIPEQFDEVKIKISNYHIQEIDDKTNTVQWTLKSAYAEASSDESQAKVIKPEMVFFENQKAQFTISSEYANLDKHEQAVDLYNDVVLKSTDGKYQVNSGQLNFQEQKPSISVANEWQLTSSEGYKITGKKGEIAKDFSHILSQEAAELKKDGINLSAKSISVEEAASVPIKAKGKSKLAISEAQNLFADLIAIHKNGSVRARGAVNVKTKKVDCFSNELEILPKANKEPKLAIFTGKPYVIQGINKIYAEVIKYDFDTEQVSMEGQIHSL